MRYTECGKNTACTIYLHAISAVLLAERGHFYKESCCIGLQATAEVFSVRYNNYGLLQGAIIHFALRIPHTVYINRERKTNDIGIYISVAHKIDLFY